jgi:predicted metal-dependent hydrolase
MAGMADNAHDSSRPAANTPVILGFVTDLFFAAKIEAAAKTVGMQVAWFEMEELTSTLEASTPALQFAEHVTGPGYVMLERITLLQPAMIIFDLGDIRFPWHEWLPLFKSDPATRRIPVIAFGAHVDSTNLKAARSAGADLVLARSAFAKDLPQFLQRMSRVPDMASIASACKESLSPLAIQGLEEFNRGEYFQAHESLEEAWNQAESPGRELYRAILQVAVAYLQIERRNYRGAMKMLLRVRQWINPLPDSCRGVDVAALRSDVRRVHDELLRTGMQGIETFDRSLMKPVIYNNVSIG